MTQANQSSLSGHHFTDRPGSGGLWIRPAVLVAIALGATAGARGATVEEEERALVLGQAGVEAYQQKRSAAATALFEEAYRMVPKPVFLFNIGHIEEEANRLIAALEVYERYLAHTDDTPKREEVGRKVEALRARFPRVEIRSDPPGARLDIDDGAESIHGTTPWTGRLGTAHYAVRLERRGYVTVTRELAIVAGEPRTLELTLEPSIPKSRLIVSAPKPGLQISVGERDLGQSPLETALELPPGTYPLRLTSPGETIVSDLALKDGDRVALHVLAVGGGSVAAPAEPMPWLAWSLVGAGGVALLAGAAAYKLGNDDYGRADDLRRRALAQSHEVTTFDADDIAAHEDAGDQRMTVAAVSGALGALALASGLVVAWRRSQAPAGEPGTAAEVQISPDGTLLGRWAF